MLEWINKGCLWISFNPRKEVKMKGFLIFSVLHNALQETLRMHFHWMSKDDLRPLHQCSGIVPEWSPVPLLFYEVIWRRQAPAIWKGKNYLINGKILLYKIVKPLMKIHVFFWQMSKTICLEIVRLLLTVVCLQGQVVRGILAKNFVQC